MKTIEEIKNKGAIDALLIEASTQNATLRTCVYNCAEAGDSIKDWKRNLARTQLALDNLQSIMLEIKRMKKEEQS